MYSRKLDGRILSLEHARFLYQRSFVMYDRGTVSLWIHTTGEAVIGEHKGKRLTFLPSTVTTWKNWRTEHPETLVLNVRKGRNPRFTLRKNPEAGGLSVGEPAGELKLYPLPVLKKERAVNDEVDGKKVVVVFDPEAWAFAAFERGDLTFTWKEGELLDQTGRRWDPLKGTAGGRPLKPVPAVPWLTRAWKRFYPEGPVYPAK